MTRRLPAIVLLAALGVCGTQARADQPADTWLNSIDTALHSGNVLVQSGAMLALRDLSLNHPDEVLAFYARQPAPLRRRLALVLGESNLRTALARQLGPDPKTIQSLIDQWKSPDYTARESATQRLAELLPFAEEALRQIADSSDDPEQVARARQLLETLTTGTARSLPPAATPAQELFRWSVAAHWIDQLAVDTRPILLYNTIPLSTRPAFWPDLSPAEQSLLPRIHELATSRNVAPSLWKDAADPDKNSPLAPWQDALLTLTGRTTFPFPERPFEDPTIPRLVPFAPLLRASILRYETEPHPPSVGNCALHIRKTLCAMGDPSGVDGIDKYPVNSAGNGMNEFERLALKARMGNREALDTLFRTDPKNWSAAEVIARSLELGQGPLPIGPNENITYWLSSKEAASYRSARESEIGGITGMGGTSEEELVFLQAAMARYRAKVADLFQQHAADLVYSPTDHRWQLKSMPQSKPAALEPYPGLSPFTADEDDLGASWYKACAARLFDDDLSIAAGAARALQWGGRAATDAALAEAISRARRGRLDDAALLRMLGHKLPDWPAALAAGNPADVRLVEDSVQAGGVREDEFLLGPRLHAQYKYDLENQNTQKLARGMRPVILPMLLVEQEENPALWSLIDAVDKDRRARPFLLREVVREKDCFVSTINVRGQYLHGYYNAIYDHILTYKMLEAVPALKRQVERKDRTALIPLARLAGTDILPYLREVESRNLFGKPSFDHLVSLDTALFAGGDVSRVNNVVELINTDYFNVPTDAAAILRTLCPAENAPDFSAYSYVPPPADARQSIYHFWHDWAQTHSGSLQWDQESRRYVLKDGR